MRYHVYKRKNILKALTNTYLAVKDINELFETEYNTYNRYIVLDEISIIKYILERHVGYNILNGYTNFSKQYTVIIDRDVNIISNAFKQLHIVGRRLSCKDNGDIQLFEFIDYIYSGIMTPMCDALVYDNEIEINYGEL